MLQPTLGFCSAGTGCPASTASIAARRSAPVSGTPLLLDLMVNTGSNNAVASQNYLTFTNSILQNVLVGSGGCGTITSTFTADNSVFDSTLQNETCNGPNPCTFRGIPTDPGSFAFASGALSNCPGGCAGDFRVAQVSFCGMEEGDAVQNTEDNSTEYPYDSRGFRFVKFKVQGKTVNAIRFIELKKTT